jgi:hypothetical protein
MKRLGLSLLAAMFLMTMGLSAIHADEDITGIWAMIDDKTNKPESFVLLYLHNGALYGRIIGLVDLDTGRVIDTIVSQTVRVENLADTPPLCGLDFVYSMQNTGKEWKGSMVTPGGKFYDCSIRRNGSGLRVRASVKGSGGLFGQNMKWLPVEPGDLPGDIVIPDMEGILPNMPQ